MILIRSNPRIALITTALSLAVFLLVWFTTLHSADKQEHDAIKAISTQLGPDAAKLSQCIADAGTDHVKFAACNKRFGG